MLLINYEHYEHANYRFITSTVMIRRTSNDDQGPHRELIEHRTSLVRTRSTFVRDRIVRI